MAVEKADGKAAPRSASWGPRPWLRGLVLGVWIGVAGGAILGGYLTKAFPKGFGIWLVVGLVPAMFVSMVLNHLLRPTKEETLARASWYRSTFSVGLRRGLRNVGLAAMCAGFAVLLAGFMLVSTGVMWIAMCFLLVSAVLIFPAAMAEPPSDAGEADGAAASDSCEAGE